MIFSFFSSNIWNFQFLEVNAGPSDPFDGLMSWVCVARFW